MINRYLKWLERVSPSPGIFVGALLLSVAVPGIIIINVILAIAGK